MVVANLLGALVDCAGPDRMTVSVIASSMTCQEYITSTPERTFAGGCFFLHGPV